MKDDTTPSKATPPTRPGTQAGRLPASGATTTPLARVTAHTRARSRPNSHAGILLAEIDRLRAAVQDHHNTKHGTVYPSAVLSPPDRAVYEAAGVEHRVLEWREGGR